MKNINYDTTSKTMWGEYETKDGKVGVISIDFGHNKQKRDDKKQIKMGIGVADGIIIDAIVLSGDKDDKTYNEENLDEVKDVLHRFNIAEEDFNLRANAVENKENIEMEIEAACFFVLCSNDVDITAENLLKEYKTQSSVEKKFQQIKSPHFVNSIYLETPHRIEALTYLILISMMMLSVA